MTFSLDAIRLSNRAWEIARDERLRDIADYEAFKARREALGRPLSDLEVLQNQRKPLDREKLEKRLTLAMIDRYLR